MWFFLLLSRLPWWFMYGLSDVLYVVACHIIKYRRKVILQNLRNSFPEKTEVEINRIAKGFYRNLSQIIVEILKAPSLTEAEMKRRVVINNQEVLTDYLSEGQTIVAVTSHLANWEYLLLGQQLQLLPYNVDALYQPLSNPLFDKLMRQIRGRFGAVMVPSRQVMRQVVKNRQEHKTVLLAMVADQSPGKQASYNTLFLNQKTLFLHGPEKIAKSGNFPVVYAAIYRVKRGHYAVDLKKVAEPPYSETGNEVLEIYSKLLEADIIRNPSDWLWSHRRWKHKVD